ncbi:MAG: hypothetical protein EWM47_05605 [Anaerolineaceae bacterium]|nr:MAG: hypothetical protein EWM47_05605 [Anaerolineaceae bacterium]
MKTKNSDIVVKIFLVVVAVILVGLIIAWSTGVFKDKRNDLNAGTERINKAISSMLEFDLLAYDGGSITGDLLVDLIKTINDNDPELTIKVETLALPNAPAEYKGASTYPSPTKEADNYINPNGIFKGKVIRNKNGIINEITFTQK